MTHVPIVFQLPQSIPFWIVFILAFGRENKIVRPAFSETKSSQDNGTFRALMVGSPVALVSAAVASLLPVWTIEDQVVAMIAGIVLIAGGAILRRLCFNALGACFTGKVVVHEGQTVIQHGVYRYIRHPSYTAAFLMFAGVGVALGSWISLFILFSACCYLYGRRVNAEEAALVETLGPAYLDYMSRTKRFIPFVI